MSSKETNRITTPEFRVSFPNVFKAVSNFANQEPVYSLEMLFPKTTDLKKLKEMEKAAAKKKWPDGKPKNYRSPFRDGDESKLPSHKGHVCIRAKTKMRPGIVDKDLNEILDPSDFYAGCWARATLTCFAYDTMGNAGVSFGLQNLQKIKDDDAFSGRANAQDDFEVVEIDDDSSGGDEWEEDDLYS